MKYRQLTPEERYAIAAFRRQGFSQARIAQALGRHPSTISREVRRNATQGRYRAGKAQARTNGRRSRSRRNRRFAGDDWALVASLVEDLWSPEQISGTLRRQGRLRISHETIYRYIWEDRRRGGSLYLNLRGRIKQRRKRYGTYDSRGRLAGKRMLAERPPGAQNRSRVGHLEGDTVMGTSNRHCVLTLVDRKTGYVMIGKLRERTVEETNRRTVQLLQRAARQTRTLTLDNGSEFHGYSDIEKETGATVYFSTPYHSWERGTNENTNGLLRQYLPKKFSMAHVTQDDCDFIADHLNDRPRKRLGFRTPRECYERSN